MIILKLGRVGDSCSLKNKGLVIRVTSVESGENHYFRGLEALWGINCCSQDVDESVDNVEKPVISGF